MRRSFERASTIYERFCQIDLYDARTAEFWYWHNLWLAKSIWLMVLDDGGSGTSFAGTRAAIVAPPWFCAKTNATVEVSDNIKTMLWGVRRLPERFSHEPALSRLNEDFQE